MTPSALICRIHTRITQPKNGQFGKPYATYI